VLEAQVEMPPPRGVLVDDEAMAVSGGRLAGQRLGSARELALLLVLAQALPRHGHEIPRARR